MLDRKLQRARWKLNSIAARFLPRSMVLIYHRVIDLESDPQRLSVTPENFTAQMEVVSHKFNLVPFSELVTDLRKGRIRDRTCAITIDDGYEDNYLNARPVLEKRGIPATVFISSGFTGTSREFWWDELDRLILQNRALPDELRFTVHGTEYRWPVSDEGPVSGWNVQSPPPESAGSDGEYTRHKIYADLCQLIQPMESAQITDTLRQLCEATGDPGEARQENIPMNAEQVVSLHNSGLFEVGAHTQNHVNLATQAVQRQIREIEGSKHDLETLLGSKVESFSYPFGALKNYSSQSIKCVRNAGFYNAVSGHSGNVTRLTNPYEIPRRVVRDWDAETFERQLERYYGP